MNKILEQIEKQLLNASAELNLFEVEENNIDWPDDPVEEMLGLNQEINYRLKRFHRSYHEDGVKLKKDIQTRYPYSYMFEGYGSCIAEVKSDGNICYDFLRMIRESACMLYWPSSSMPEYEYFSELDGLKGLCEYLYKVVVTEGKIEPILLINDCEIKWLNFTYNAIDHMDEIIAVEEYSLHLEYDELGTWDEDWDLDFFPFEDNIESLKLEWQD